jgi:hypothetical protein
MPRIKYKFNPDSLSFDKIKLGVKALLLRLLAYLTGSIIIAIAYWIIFASFFDSPKEKALKREVAQLTIQYDLIHMEMGNIEKVLDDLQKTDDNLYRTIFGAEPIPATLRGGGVGGVNRYKELEGYTNAKLVIETASRLDRIIKKVYIQSKSFDELITLAKEKEDMMQSIPAILPISNKDLTRTASGYGLRIHPYYKITRFHYGMDFTAPSGTDIYATGNGVVAEVLSSKRGLGNNIVINHGFNVRKGQKVKRGDIIGFVGSTGMSLAPHLHYEIKINGQNVDPVNYYFNDLSAEDYERIIEIASKTGQSFD